MPFFERWAMGSIHAVNEISPLGIELPVATGFLVG